MRKLFLLIVSMTIPLMAMAGGEAMPFLKLGVGARAQGLGGAYMARVDDASAVHWNASALSYMKQQDLFFYHSQYFSGYSNSYVAFAQPLPRRFGTLGVGVGYFTKGNFQRIDENQQSMGTFHAADAVGALSYSRRLSDGISLGLTGKVMQSTIDRYSAKGYAADISATKDIFKPTRLSAGVFNLGPAVKFIDEADPLPVTAATGISQKIGRYLAMTGEIRYGLRTQRWSSALGGEVTVSNIAALRMGYIYNAMGGSAGVAKPISGSNLDGFGIGVSVRLMSDTWLDYAFKPMGELGDTHHVSLNIRFKK